MRKTEISKQLSYVLRHKPESIGISLDKHGWANVQELIDKINPPITFDILEEIVMTDDKQRYSFNEDKTLIRANQGHSIPVDIELQKVIPKIPLFHGTSSRFSKSIDKTGLKKMNRNYVHLSPNVETAIKVGKRHGGKLIIYQVDVAKMIKDGFTFYKSVNNVYLIDNVPAKYLIKWSEEKWQSLFGK